MDQNNKNIIKIPNFFFQVHALFYNEHFKDAKEAKGKNGGITVIAVQVQVGTFI